MSPTPASYPNCPRKPPVNPVNKVNPVPIPNQEGWWWAKGRLGWTCVRVRQLDGVWVGLNPYDGIERPLHFPNDAYWDGITWHDQVPLPSPPGHQPGWSLQPVWNEQELGAIQKLAKMKDMDTAAVIRQALRQYHAVAHGACSITWPPPQESPRDTRNDGDSWTEPDRSGGGGHTPDEIRLAAGDVW